MHRINLVGALLVTALVASACGGGSGDGDTKAPKLSQPKAGQCIAKEVPDGEDVAPDTQAVVPCSEDHTYEIVAVVPVPDDLLAGKTDKEKLARRTELADINDDESKLRKRLEDEVSPQCDEPIRKASGLAGLTVQGKTAKETNLRLPPGNVSEWFTLTSPELWLDGTTQVVCSYRFAPPTPDSGVVSKLTPMRSADSEPVVASYLTSTYPVSLRACRDAMSSENRVPCTAAHSQELLFSLDIKAVYGKDFLSGAKLSDVNDDQQTKLHQACLDPLKQAGGRLTDKTTLSFRFDTSARTTATKFTIFCVLTSTDDSSLGDTFVAFGA